MLKLNIFNQRLSYFADSEVVADSKGYLTFTLETSEDWANYVGKTVQFTRDAKTYSVTNIMDNVEYAVPWEVLVGAGIMYVNAFAVAETGKRATTNQIAVEITASGLNEDDLKPTDPTPDIFQQYVKQVQENADKASQSAKEATQSASEALNYKNKSQEIYQNIIELKDNIDIVNGQVNQAAQNAFQSAQQAEQSAQNAAESEIQAASHESEAKLAAQDAAASESNAESYMNAAIDAKQEATSQADRAQANQEIVTETKADIDTIYADIQTKQEDITEKQVDITDKANTINEQYNSVKNYYENFVLGSDYIEFSDSGWVKTPNVEEEYTLTLPWTGEAILNIQVYEETTNSYYITNFADIVLQEFSLIIKAVYPFTGRIMCHALLEASEVNKNGNN